MKKVTAALLIKDNRILIAKRRANDKLANKWEFPGGKIEDAETPEECLKREMKEEFQIEVTVGEYFGESVYSYDHGSIQLLAYWTYWKSGELIPTVHDDFKWVTIDELANFDFAPADIPLVNKLRSERIEF
ncbi:MAG: (deoxy)nucleoside triphosphate pyrophosphohydrolase [Desulfotomaculum sp.]|nr:(deoxy)nucleoside triphosphate pyrophosphohydrolase [Desulfotomaculum sp.]